VRPLPRRLSQHRGKPGDTFGISTDNTNLAAGDWIRHPTDYAMPTTGEYAGYAAYQPETRWVVLPQPRVVLLTP